jgi:NSS family neurotransmitter:Na+ symporter
VAWLVENRGMNRVKASAWAGLGVWVLGIFSLLSLNVWSEYKLFGKNFMDLLDFASANVMLPLGGLLIAVFASWIMSEATARDELQMDDHLGYRVWRFLVRYIAPLAVGLVLLNATGIIEVGK